MLLKRLWDSFCYILFSSIVCWMLCEMLIVQVMLSTYIYLFHKVISCLPNKGILTVLALQEIYYLTVKVFHFVIFLNIIYHSWNTIMLALLWKTCCCLAVQGFGCAVIITFWSLLGPLAMPIMRCDLIQFQ